MFNPEAFVKYKDLPNLTSIFGNLGNSWNNPLPNDLFIKGVPKNIARGGNAVGNQGTGLDQLYSFTFPGKSLANNLDYFEVILAGPFGTNDDNKRIKLSFGGNTLLDTGLMDFDGNGFGFSLYLFGIRINSTQVNIDLRHSIGLLQANSTPALITSLGFSNGPINYNLLTINNMDTNSNDLVLEGESATATNENVVCNVQRIYLARF